jgi:phosphate transport system substrate-binding protein
MKSKLNKYLITLLSLPTMMFWAACDSESQKETATTPVTTTTLISGHLNVAADDTFKPLLGTTVEVFEALHPEATIAVDYQAQEKSFQELIQGKVDVVIAGRTLLPHEEAQLFENRLIPKTNQIASDALALVVSPQYPDSLIKLETLAAILQGKLSGQLVCDKSNSGNMIFLKNYFELPDRIAQVAAAGSDSAVLEYIKTHPKAIGLIGMGMISDFEDPKVKKRLSEVKVLSVQYKDSTGAEVVSYPSQDHLATDKYPFQRRIYLINLDGKTNLGTGFASFVVSQRGQRIVLKAGLMPYTLPTRQLLINP